MVAKVTGALMEQGCNLEDSSMMRLGSEFGMFVIFTSTARLSVEKIKKHTKLKGLFLEIKPISPQDASFIKPNKEPWIVRVHGADKPGLVHRVTQCLADHKFNITDLSTHRTAGRVAGYVLFLEGDPVAGSVQKLGAALQVLAGELDTHISFSSVSTAPF